MTAKDDPVVLEAAAVLREWGQIWQDMFVVSGVGGWVIVWCSVVCECEGRGGVLWFCVM